MGKVKLSIIMPVYNERHTLKQIIKEVMQLNIKDVEKEVIIIDDGSTDGSREILKSLERFGKGDCKIFYHRKNLGKGTAVNTGIQRSSGDIIIIQDADLEYDPKEIPKLLQPIINNEVEVVYGSRFLRHHKPQYPVYYFGNIVLSWVTTLIFFTKITDMETCYKVFKREVIKDIKLKARGFDLEPEITAKILKNGYKIKELSISFRPRKFEEGKKITWKDGLMAIFYLLKYRFFD